MKWLKYTETFADGYGAVNYIPFKDEDALAIWKEEIKERGDMEYSYSDKWRGYEWEIVETPTVEWLKSRIESTKDSIAGKQNYLKMLEEVMDARMAKRPASKAKAPCNRGCGFESRSILQ